jgi:hypothetical protein
MEAQYDLTGQKFGRLTVLDLFGKGANRENKWRCICECGNETISSAPSLRNGHKKSCGCIQREYASKLRKTIHGETVKGKVSSEYGIWSKMKGRCHTISDDRYEDYGGRGIFVCERWRDEENGFINFLSDMGRRPSPNKSIERRDNDKGYYKENCYWATPKEQSKNRRSNVWIEYNGERMVMKDWSERLGVDNRLVHRMLKQKPFSEVYEFYINKKKAS